MVAREVRTIRQTSRKEPSLSFFDDGDEPRTAIRSRQPQPQPRRPPARARHGSADDRTLLLRRGAAAAVVLIVLIGVVLAVKAVLNNQAVQGLKNYNANLSGLVANEQSLVPEFFHQVDNAFSSSNPTEVPTNLQQYISQESGYYHQALGWSVPGQMVGAQRWFVEALGLRYEALQGIAADMKDALAVTSGQGHAIRLIAGQMEKLLSADVIYTDRVAPLVQQALVTAGISGQITPSDTFLPDVNWLIPQTVAQRILGYVPTSLGGAPSTGSPGHELTGVAVESASGTSTSLQTSGVNTFTYTPAGITFVLSVLNSGTLTEHAVATKISFQHAGLNTSCLTSTNTISQTKPGYSYQSTIVFAPSTCTNISAFFGLALKMYAEVVPLPGETDKANNYQEFLVEFNR